MRQSRTLFGLLLLPLVCLFMSCASSGDEAVVGKPEKAGELPRFALWVHGKKKKSDADWQRDLSRLKEAGITDLFVGAGPEELKRMINLANEFNLLVHGWIWTLNRPGDKVASEHPEWYAVNRNNQNSLEYRAYVGYYQWLSPFSEGAREHIKNNIRRIAAVEGLASIHLDYVRYCDVILATGLQPKYKLVQDREMPEYDFGYHPVARKRFKDLFGVDPLTMKNPSLSNEWRQMRLNAVTSLVNELADIAHEQGLKASAAVFPFPEMSRQMVRQDWDKWQLDIFLPMIYHNFYEKDVPWIGFCTRQGVRDLKGRAALYAGLYLPSLTPQKLEEAIDVALKNGADGVSLFDRNSLNDEKLATLRRVTQRIRAQ